MTRENTASGAALDLTDPAVLAQIGRAVHAMSAGRGLDEMSPVDAGRTLLDSLGDLAGGVGPLMGVDGDDPRHKPMAEVLEPLMESMLEEKALRDAKHVANHRRALRFFLEFAGDKTLADLTPADIVIFRRMLTKLPYRSNDACEGMTFPEVIAWVEEQLAVGEEVRLVSEVRLQSAYRFPLRNLLAYAAEHGWADPRLADSFSKPFKGPRHGKNKTEARLPFFKSELETLFRSPLYVGAKGPRRLGHYGPYRENGWKYWLPLLMMAAGLRPDEAARLEVDHIHEVELYDTGDYIWAIDLDAVGELKTQNALRYIPVHPQLVKAGFLEFVEHQRAQGHRRLFPNWTKGKRGGNQAYSAESNKFFNVTYLPQLGLKSEDRVLYSFRHNFKDSLRTSALTDDEKDRLMGHSDGSVKKTYGSRRLYSGIVDRFSAIDMGIGRAPRWKPSSRR